MSDWTPTTKQVRDGYRFDPEDDYHNPLQAGANAERAGRDFDRWLDEVKAEAWEEGYESAALRIPEGVWHDVAAPHPGNPYRQEQENE